MHRILVYVNMLTYFSIFYLYSTQFLFDINFQESGTEHREKILEKRFEYYNRDWLHALAQQHMSPLITGDSGDYSTFEASTNDQYYEHEVMCFIVFVVICSSKCTDKRWIDKWNKLNKQMPIEVISISFYM